MALESDFQLTIEYKLRLGLRNHKFHWNHGIELQLGIIPPLMSHGGNIVFGLDWKLDFCLVRHIAIFAIGGEKQ